MILNIDYDKMGEILFWYFLPVFSVTLYYLYCYKYKFYKWTEKGFDERNLRNKLPRGKCPPSYPYGWYRLCRSNELKVGQVTDIKLCGRNIAYFRGQDQIVYAVDAYCTHMGAKLSGGKIKHGSCIECPFHGWTFDGKTGLCVNSDMKDAKTVQIHAYEDITFQKVGKLVECGEGSSKLQTYILRELNGIVLIWLHPDSLDKPYFEPINVNLQNMSMRGESLNYVNCHIQEIPENGADIKHFDFVHETLAEVLFPLFKMKWQMKSKCAADEDFYQVISHEIPKFKAYQKNLFDEYLQDKERLKYINVLIIDGYIECFKWRYHILTGVGFQLGSSTVYLYVKLPFWETFFQQGIQPIDRFTQKVYHTMWTSSHIPYWLSAYSLYAEIRQVMYDVKIWNKKIFSDKVCYNLKNDADRNLLAWRNWYGQFYEGSYEYQKKLDQLEW